MVKMLTTGKVNKMNLIKSSIYINTIDNMLTDTDLSILSNKTVLITGASGMIGSCLIDALMRWNLRQELPCKIIALSRNEKTVNERFADYLGNENIKFIFHDINKELTGIDNAVDYIIHAASNADPVNIAKYPVDTLTANIIGTNNLLKFGLKHGMKRFLYISSGEMYGQPNNNNEDFKENYSGYIDCANPRSCYPSGKRAAEVLCQSYISQFNVDIVIARPCHIFGPTMTKNDSRAVSEFFRKSIYEKKIVLKSKGLIERSHCYVIDAVKALLIILKNGSCGEAYNIADPRYQMTIKEFATKVAEISGAELIYDLPNDVEMKGYSYIKRSVLNSEKLEEIGWKSMGNEKNRLEETFNILKMIC